MVEVIISRGERVRVQVGKQVVQRSRLQVRREVQVIRQFRFKHFVARVVDEIDQANQVAPIIAFILLQFIGALV